MKAIALAIRTPICHSCFRCGFFLMPLVFLLVCFAPCQMAQAVSPAPDGGYAGNNTAEGTSALFSLTSGADNTAIGFQALFHNTSGTFNSGEGFARSLAIPLACSTPPRACKRLTATRLARKTRP